MPAAMPAGRHTIPTAQNQPVWEKWMIDTPAITRAIAERRYARRVLSFANRVRSIASSSRKIRSSLSNLEYGVSFISSFLIGVQTVVHPSLA